MGNYRSGRRRSTTTGTVEDHLSLDLRWLRRSGFVRRGARRSLDLSWITERHGSEVARCIVHLRLSEDGSGYVEVGPSPTVLRQRVTIVARPTAFGGRRMYYMCPLRGHRCEVLYLREGMFASRQAHRLSYRSQSRPSLQVRIRALCERSRLTGGMVG